MSASEPLPVPAPVDGRITLTPGRYRLERTLWTRSGELTILGAPGVELEWRPETAGTTAIQGARLTLTDLTLSSLGSGDLVVATERLTCERVTFEGLSSQWGTAVQLQGKGQLTDCTWRWQLGHLVSVAGRGHCEVLRGEASGNHFGFIARDDAALRLRGCHVGPTAVALASAVDASRLKLEACRAEQLQGAAIEAQGHARLEAHDVVLEQGDRCGALLRDHAQAAWTGGALANFTVSGLEVRGEARLTLRDTRLSSNAWAGLDASELAQVTATGVTLCGNRFGALATGASTLKLLSSTVEANTSRGLEAQDQATLTTQQTSVGPHPDGACVSWHLSRTEGLTFEQMPLALEQRLPWVQGRLARAAEYGPSRRALLRALPEVLSHVPSGPWFAQRLLEREQEVCDKGWPAVLAWLDFETSADASVVKAALGLTPPTAPVLALAWRVPLSGARALAVEDEGRTAWTATDAGRVQAWRADAEVASWQVDGPVERLHAAFDHVATAGKSVGLFTREGSLVQSWSLSNEAPIALRVVSHEALDVSLVETSGHPTDRTSRRARYRVGGEREVLATGQSAPPLDALGVEGLDWQPPPRVETPTAPGLRCDGWAVSFTARDGATTQWQAPAAIIASWVGADAALLLTPQELLRVELRQPQASLPAQPLPPRTEG